MSKIEKYEIIGKEQKFPDDQDNLPFWGNEWSGSGY
jgi:hypothetical protein